MSSNKVEKIILNDQSNLTSDEKDMQMLKLMETRLNTGPIIGEARDVLLQLSRNLLVRDLYLDVLGISVDQRQDIFNSINKALAKRDKEILKARGKA